MLPSITFVNQVSIDHAIVDTNANLSHAMTSFSRSGQMYSFNKKRMQFVLTSDLPFLDRMRYSILRQHDSSGDRPRANVGAIIQAWHISDASCLVKARLSADFIPAAVDVPIQRVSLTDLGHLALALGCSEL
jgi:hypothetical protein